MSSTQYTDLKSAPDGSTYTPGPPAYGQPAYGQPAYGQPAYGQPHSQNTVIVSQPATVVIAPAQDRPSNTGSIIFSCCVFWCCCWPLGLAAFICAVQAGSVPDVREAHEKLGTSKKLSIAGLVCGIVLIILITVLRVVVFTTTQQSNEQTYG